MTDGETGPKPLPLAECAIEAALLGLFMLSACVCTALVEHPGSLVRAAIDQPLLRRALIGLAMGATAIALVHSPWGRRSGAHFNPAVTLTFHRLGKVGTRQTLGYVAAQILGGLAGVQLAALLLGPALAHPYVAFATTVPGPAGALVAFLAESTISFVQMGAVLVLANGRWARHTGVVAGALVATWITFEAPLSGMSMNPARTIASAVAAGEWRGIWIYASAPLLGMLAAAEVYVRLRGRHHVHCAKLRHQPSTLGCIFRCTHGALTGASAELAHVAVRLLLVFVVLAAPAALAAADQPARVVASGPITVVVSDLDRATDFYRHVLGFTPSGETEVGGKARQRLRDSATRVRVATLRLGNETLALVEFAPRGRPVPHDARANDLDFQHVAIVVRDMARAHAWLRDNGVRPASPAPQRLPDWNPSAGGIEAFYFRDPDGHFLELIAFPPGKGDARWHRPGSDLFLGIDHTAIVVADTGRSLRFYRDLLGLRVAGTSENLGPEQERLNAVPGAHLLITTLRAPSGPGIELLEYLAPRDGRPAPADERPSDLANWRTRLVVADRGHAARALRAAGTTFASDVAVRLPNDTAAPSHAVVVQDPDGHDLEIDDAPGARGAQGDVR